MTHALAAPASWRPPARARAAGAAVGRNGSSGGSDEGVVAGAGRNGSSRASDEGVVAGAGRNGSSSAGDDGVVAGAGRNGSSRASERGFGGRDGVAGGVGLDAAVVGFDEIAEIALRRSARTLHAACAELLPGYAAASREPWRQALLTAGCLDGRPRHRAARRAAPPLIVEDVVQPSDVLCALWLARRCGLFSPGSPCGDGIGLRSACEIVPQFTPDLAPERRAAVLEALRANTAWRAHRLARAA